VLGQLEAGHEIACDASGPVGSAAMQAAQSSRCHSARDILKSGLSRFLKVVCRGICLGGDREK